MKSDTHEFLSAALPSTQMGQVHVNVWGGQVCRPWNGNREQSDDHAGSPLHSVGVFGLEKKEADYDSSLDRDTRRLKIHFL